MIRKKESITYLVILLVFLSGFFVLGKPAFAVCALVMVVYWFLAFLSVYFSGRKMEINLSSSGENRKDEEFSFFVSAKNNSLVPVFGLEGDLISENKLVGERKTMPIKMALGPKEERVCPFTLLSPNYGEIDRVLHDIGVVDPLGLFKKNISVDVQDTRTVIFPDYSRLNISSDALDVYDMESYRYVDGKVGGDTSETVGIREYRQGDNVRSIHWKLTAKNSVPLIKEAGFPVSNRVTLILDKRLNQGDCYEEMNLLTEYGLSFSKSLLDLGIEHHVYWLTLEKGEAIPLPVYYEVRNEDEFYEMSLGFLATGFFDYVDVDYSVFEKGAEKYILITNKKEFGSSEEEALAEMGNAEIIIPGKTE